MHLMALLDYRQCRKVLTMFQAQRSQNQMLQINQEVITANQLVQKYEEKYRLAYKQIMELIISNFESKNTQGLDESLLKIE